VKESDRLGAMARGLAACGATVEEGKDWLKVTGSGKAPKGGARIAVNLDHRPAMSFLVMGMAAGKPIEIDDGGPIDTSFPGFTELMNGLGAGIGLLNT
jgi:3-phosphoshikimate 1-carboxyvinyltransferase